MEDESQLTVKFVTKLAEELRVPETGLEVPANITRWGLSQVINHLLGLEPPAVFDFLVDGELLRTPLEEHLAEKKVSTEAVVVIEYTKLVLPPKQKEEIPHDDWVYAVHLPTSDTVWSGAADGMLRVYDSNLECTSATLAHEMGVTTIAGFQDASGLCTTAGKDARLRMWRIEDDAPPELLATYSGHTDAVEDAAVSPSGRALVSAGWDGRVLMWRSGAEVAEAGAEVAAPPSRKKKKSKDSGVPTGGAEEEAVNELEGHTQCASCVCWSEGEQVYSGSWDHTMRRWDAETGTNTDTLNTNKAILSCATSPSGAGIVAFGSCDRLLRLWDTRGKGETIAMKAYASHTGWIGAVAWSPTSDHSIATASYDGLVKVWDTRSSVPLASLPAHDDKAFCCAWGPGGARLASGGADRAIKLFETPGS